MNHQPIVEAGATRRQAQVNARLTTQLATAERQLRDLARENHRLRRLLAGQAKPNPEDRPA